MVHRGLWLLALAAWALALTLPLLRSEGYLWDYFAKLDSVQAFLHGLNPYTQEGLDAVYPSKNTLTYIYPPLTIYLFIPMAWIDPILGAKLFYLASILAALVLLYVWQKGLFDLRLGSPQTLFFLLFAFNGTILWDLAGSNISVLEQLAIWTGVWLLLQGRTIIYTILVLAAAACKLTPIAFLWLLIFLPQKIAWREFIGGTLVFLSYLAANYFFFPEWTIDFLLGANMRSGQDGILNPSTLSFIRGSIATFNSFSLPIKLSISLAKPLYAVCALIFLTTSFLLIWKRRNIALQEATKKTYRWFQIETALYFALLFVLMHPRYKCYQYVVVLPATLYCLRNFTNIYPVSIAFFFLFFPHHIGSMGEIMASSPLPGPIRKTARLFFEYLPYVATILIWLFYTERFWQLVYPRPKSISKHEQT